MEERLSPKQTDGGSTPLENTIKKAHTIFYIRKTEAKTANVQAKSTCL